MSFGATLWIIAGAGVIASYVAWRVEWISRSLWFRWGGLVLFVVLFVLMRLRMNTIQMPEGLDFRFAFTLVLSMVAACLCWGPFIAFFLSHAVVGMVRSAVSLDNIKVPPSYSQAEGAAAQKDYAKAMLLYHQAGLEHPAESEPHRRMGEIFLLLNQPDDAIASFRDAQERQQNPADQLPMVFRISETFAERKNDVPGAIRVIEDFLSRHPEVDGRAFAEERLRTLRARASEGAPSERQNSK